MFEGCDINTKCTYTTLKLWILLSVFVTITFTVLICVQTHDLKTGTAQKVTLHLQSINEHRKEATYGGNEEYQKKVDLKHEDAKEEITVIIKKGKICEEYTIKSSFPLILISWILTPVAFIADKRNNEIRIKKEVDKIINPSHT